MFDCTKDSASALEERKLLQQMVSLGVGYPYGKSWFSKAAISDANILHRCISSMLSFQKYSDVGNITRKTENRILNGDDGCYLLDLHRGRILARGQHPIEDIIIDFTLLGTNDRILLRRRKGASLHDIGFLITPNTVCFLGMNRAYISISEFHMLSFISLDNNSRSGFVVDYDATQNDRPLVLFPYEENNDIIQSQLDQDDHCLAEEYKSLIGNAGFSWKHI